MKYNNLIKKISFLKELNNKTIKQANIMIIPLMNKVISENGINEIQVQYDNVEIINNFLYNEKKTLFFISLLLNTYIKMLKDYKDYLNKRNIILPTNQHCDELTYYFDSFISSFSTIIEPEQKNALEYFLDKKELNKFYPTRNKYGIYWQINIIRNRILHFPTKRYDYTKKECFCYEPFSSRIKAIKTDLEGNISIPSSLLDIYSDNSIKNAINLSIKDKKINPFDILFPNISAKGYSKKKPFVLHIINNIFFDYATSAIDLIEEVEKILDQTNNLLINYLSQYYTDINELKKTCTIIKINRKSIKYRISDVFMI